MAERTIKEMDSISRKDKRFYRRNAELFDKIKEQILRAEGLREREKRKILMRLRFQIGEMQEKEGIEMSSALYDQVKKGGTDVGELASREARRRGRGRAKKFGENDLNFIADNIFSQLKDEGLPRRRRGKRASGRETRGRKYASWRDRKGIPSEKEAEVEKIKQDLAEKLSGRRPLESLEKGGEAPSLGELEDLKNLDVEDIVGGKKGKAKKKKKKGEFDLEGLETDLG